MLSPDRKENTGLNVIAYFLANVCTAFQCTIQFLYNIESTWERCAIVIWHVKNGAHVLFFSKPQPCPACDYRVFTAFRGTFLPSSTLLCVPSQLYMLSSVISHFTVFMPPNLTHEYCTGCACHQATGRHHFSRLKAGGGDWRPTVLRDGGFPVLFPLWCAYFI